MTQPKKIHTLIGIVYALLALIIVGAILIGVIAWPY